MPMITPYNPLDKHNLGNNVAEALLRSEVHSLGDLSRFQGAGVYSIYYTGDFSSYTPLSEQNKNNLFKMPIYVGKAVSAGARKGNFGLDEEPGTALYQRLREHADSIARATNLELADFYCRFLVVDDIWIPLGESLLIAKFSPIWNKLVDGFGNHDPGRGRYQQMRSRWDTLHPGRTWATRCEERPESAAEIQRDILAFFAANIP